MKIQNIKEMTINDCIHAKENHLLVNDKDLIDRLLYGDVETGKIIGIQKNIASRFESEERMLFCIQKTIEKNADVIKTWIRDRSEKRLIINCVFQKQVGLAIVKGTPFKNKYPMYACTVILQLGYNGSEFQIVTAFPDATIPIIQKIQKDKKEYRNTRPVKMPH